MRSPSSFFQRDEEHNQRWRRFICVTRVGAINNLELLYESHVRLMRKRSWRAWLGSFSRSSTYARMTYGNDSSFRNLARGAVKSASV